MNPLNGMFPRLVLLLTTVGAVTPLFGYDAQVMNESNARLLSSQKQLEEARKYVAEIEMQPARYGLGEHTNALCFLAESLVRVRRFDDAGDVLRRAEVEADALPPEPRAFLITKVRLVSANRDAVEGKTAEAVKTLEGLLLDERTPAVALRTIRMRLIDVLSATKQFVAAEKQLAIWRKSPGSSEDRVLLTYTCNNQIALRKWEDAEVSARASVRIALNDVEKSAALIMLSSIVSNENRHPEAAEILERANAAINSIPQASPMIATLKVLYFQAQVLNAHRSQKPADVERLLLGMETTENTTYLWVLFTAKINLNKLRDAVTIGEKYLKLSGADARWASIGSEATAHYLLAWVHLQLKHPSDASRELSAGLEWELKNNSQLSSSTVDDSVYYREGSTRGDPVSLAASLDDPKMIEQALRVTQGFDYKALQKKDAYVTQPLRGAQRLLEGETLLALFEYADAANGTANDKAQVNQGGALVLKKGRPATFVRLGAMKPIVEKLLQFFESTGRESEETEDRMIGALSELHDLVAQPLIKSGSLTKTILCSGDGAFANLPFHLLWHDGKFLVAERDVAYLPFFDVLNRDGRTIKRNPSVIIGDAVYSAGDALPTAGKECRMVADAFAAKNVLLGDVLTQEKADEAHFLKIVSPAFLHVVAHGTSKWVADVEGSDLVEMLDRRLNSSLIILSKSEAANGRWGKEKYNLISGANVLGCDFSGTNCVVLHACRSGVGVPANREGNIGLLTGLLSVGPHRAVLTSWNIIDDFAPPLASTLYREAIFNFDGTQDVHLFSEFQRTALADMQENQSVWKAVRSAGALCLYLGCR